MVGGASAMMIGHSSQLTALQMLALSTDFLPKPIRAPLCPYSSRPEMYRLCRLVLSLRQSAFKDMMYAPFKRPSRAFEASGEVESRRSGRCKSLRANAVLEKVEGKQGTWGAREMRGSGGRRRQKGSTAEESLQKEGRRKCKARGGISGRRAEAAGGTRV